MYPKTPEEAARYIVFLLTHYYDLFLLGLASAAGFAALLLSVIWLILKLAKSE